MTYLNNPWIWLLTAIIVYYLIKRLELDSKYYGWKEKREYEAEAEHIKKNPDFYRQRMEAMERARQKQQVKLFLNLLVNQIINEMVYILTPRMYIIISLSKSLLGSA